MPCWQAGGRGGPYGGVDDRPTGSGRDWTLIWNERYLHGVLTRYLRHYDTARPHRSLDLQPPTPTRPLTLVEPSCVESVQRVDVLNGLIHEYRHAA